MDSKKAISIFAVALLALCPLFVASICVDADTNEPTEKAVTLEFKDKDYTKISKVVTSFDSMIISLIGADMRDSGDFKSEMSMSTASIVFGMKNTVDGDNITENNLIRISGEFVIKITAQKDGVSLGSSVPTGVTGEGITKFNNLLSTQLNKGESLELSGKINFEYHMKNTNTYYKNDTLGYLVTAQDHKLSEVLDLDVTLKCKGQEIEKIYTADVSATQKATTDYGKELSQVKQGDSCTTKIDDAVFDKFDMDMKIKIDGKDQELNYDKSKSKKETKIVNDYTEAYFQQESYLKKDITVYSLPLVDELRKQTDVKVIEKAITDNGGTISYDVDFFDKEAEAVDDDASANGGKDDKTMIYVIVAIVVILIIIGILVWYFKFRN